MEIKNKAYSIRFFPVVMAGANLALTWNLNNQNRNMLVKSLAWDLKICRTVTFEPIPLEQNTFLLAVMGTQAGVPNMVSNIFQDIVGTAAFVTGQNLWFTTPGQYQFNSFFISNVLGFFMNLTNTDMANAYQIYSQVIVETEDTDIKGL